MGKQDNKIVSALLSVLADIVIEKRLYKHLIDINRQIGPLANKIAIETINNRSADNLIALLTELLRLKNMILEKLT